MQEVYQFIIEDEKRDLTNLMTMMPLARSAMDKDTAKALADYHKTVAKELDKMTPWISKKRSKLSNLRKKIKSGTTVVIPDASDGANNPMFKDANVRKDS